MRDQKDLLNKFLHATTSQQVREILREIGDRGSSAELDEPFGKQGFLWHPFGGNPSNISTIGLGTKPGRALAERVTNAIDAILEERAQKSTGTLPESARAAAQKWFGRPVSGPDSGMYSWDFASRRLDRRIHVVLQSSDVETAPTIDVMDDGIGLKPEQFPDTILSLQSGNKITKWYLIGAFGQGGSASLSFCDYCLVVSRHKDQPNIAGFTLIRVLSLSERYKEDTYAYLALRTPEGTVTVPSCELGMGLLSYEQAGPKMRLPMYTKGTLVRHYTYRLASLSGTLGPSPASLYHYLNYSMFDPLLPFRVVDLRGDRQRNELVTGSRNHLMKLLTKRAKGDPEMRHYHPMEYVVPYGSPDASVGIEYWVTLNYRRGHGAKKRETVLRGQSNELYLQPGHPVIGSLNGQNQGELTSRLLREMGLGMVSRHIVVHMDASSASSKIRRELFSTNREGFKEGPVLESLQRVLVKMLSEDTKLYALERELTEKMARSHTRSSSAEVKKQVARLLLEAGFHPGRREGLGALRARGNEPAPDGASAQGISGDGHRPLHAEPLPTLPFPDVTQFQIVHPRPEMRIAVGGIETVLVQTDADAEFDRRGLLAIRIEPQYVLELAAKAPLRGGRVRWRLRPTEGAQEGEKGRVIATLTRPDGSQLTDSVAFEVTAAKEARVKPERGQVPQFDIYAVHPLDNAEEWGMVWPDLLDRPSDEQAGVAYKPVRQGEGIAVYYSTFFSPFRDQVERLKTHSQAAYETFRTNYEIWVGYHAILQESGRKEEVTDEQLERMEEAERVRVARMQVKQATALTELTLHSARNQDGNQEEELAAVS